MHPNSEMATIDQEVQMKFTDDRNRAVTNIIFTASWIKTFFTKLLKPYSLSVPQFNILRILRGANDWLEMTEVKNRMVEKAPNATRLADKLLDKGYIKRCRSDQDRRVVHVCIAPKGLKLLKKIDEAFEEADISFMERITQKEARELSRIIDKLRT